MKKDNKILIEIYNSSLKESHFIMRFLVIVEIGLIIYSFIKPIMKPEIAWNHRMMYLSLIVMAFVYFAICHGYKKDPEHRFVWLKTVNPLYVAGFLCWAIIISHMETMTTGELDEIVFIIISSGIPICFYVRPKMYAIITTLADCVILLALVFHFKQISTAVNFTISLFFQFTFGMSFLRLKWKMAEHIIAEKKNAEIDSMTGLYNRRRFEADMQEMAEMKEDVEYVYISADVNGLKTINDSLGHKMGDRLLVGAVECLKESFGEKAKMYRIGGDEFVIILHTGQEEADRSFEKFEHIANKWSDENEMSLHMAFGCVNSKEYVEYNHTEIGVEADRRMYADKSRFYQKTGE